MSSNDSSLPGQETLLASWSALARTSPGARLVRSASVAAAVFPAWAPLNNAIVLNDADAAAVASQLTDLYARAEVNAWALWMPSRAVDLEAPDIVRNIGSLQRDTTTLVMHATDLREHRRHDGVISTSIASATRATDEPVAVVDLAEPEHAPGLTAWVMIRDDAAVAGAWSFLHERDCGIYAVGTSPAWRRRGLARSLVEHVLAEAARQGARTATLQSTPMAQRLYASLGFEPAGRYEEWLSQ